MYLFQQMLPDLEKQCLHPLFLARASPSDSGSIPITAWHSSKLEFLSILYIRSVPMLPDPIIAHLIFFILNKV